MPASQSERGAQRLRFDYAVKRAMDLVISAMLLLLLSPLLLGVSIAIKVTSKGPLFYPCDWVGQKERVFRGYKFRTMVAGAAAMESELQSKNEMQGPAFKLTDDPRITRLGHFLRKFSIDELPQLWSVLKGDMSLVGPRPPRLHEFLRFTEYQKGKLAVKPGMTCLWQVEGRHRISDYDDWVARDLEYINHWSLGLDLKILFKTFFVVLAGSGK
jgi:lipopolysaccharide/colanic/teichoic acid biosynthesis glycosyltransferase